MPALIAHATIRTSRLQLRFVCVCERVLPAGTWSLLVRCRRDWCRGRVGSYRRRGLQMTARESAVAVGPARAVRPTVTSASHALSVACECAWEDSNLRPAA